MSKFEEHFGEAPLPGTRRHSRWMVAKAAWNARGKVDAEICRAKIGTRWVSIEAGNECAEAIEKEQWE